MTEGTGKTVFMRTTVKQEVALVIDKSYHGQGWRYWDTSEYPFPRRQEYKAPTTGFITAHTQRDAIK